jgi:hypothetical protein
MIRNKRSSDVKGTASPVVVFVTTAALGAIGLAHTAWSAARSGFGIVMLPSLALLVIPISLLALAAGIASCFDRRDETRQWLEEQRRQ